VKQSVEWVGELVSQSVVSLELELEYAVMMSEGSGFYSR
jgi:hypothetical protein